MDEFKIVLSSVGRGNNFEIGMTAEFLFKKVNENLIPILFKYMARIVLFLFGIIYKGIFTHQFFLSEVRLLYERLIQNVVLVDIAHIAYGLLADNSKYR